MELDKYTNDELETRAQRIVESRQRLDVELLFIFAEIKKRRIDLLSGYSGIYDYCERKLGLSKGQANKRKQALKTIEIAPETIPMLKNGETHVSNLALLASKITCKNKDKILEVLPTMSRGKLALFLQTIDQDGNPTSVEPRIEVTIRCTEEMIEKLDRLQGLLVQSQGAANKDKVVDRALDALLDKIDPIKKQERKERRAQKAPTQKRRPHKNNPGDKSSKRKFSAHVISEVRKRDGFQCSYIGSSGVRCGEKSVLQSDHKVPWSKGGKSDLMNARTLCFAHNRVEAERLLGLSFMQGKIESALHARPRQGGARSSSPRM